MTPTVETWTGTIAEIGAIYPFLGTEVILVVAAFVFWIVWHLIQLGQESAENQHVLEEFIDTSAVQSSVQKAAEQSDD